MSSPVVLVVDPNPATIRRVEEALEGSAFRLVVAREPAEVEARVHDLELVCVLASASLPRGNGYELARHLRDRYPDAPILLMTGGFEVYNATRAQEAGVSGHIAKPFSAAALRQQMERVVGPFPPASIEPAELPVIVPHLPPDLLMPIEDLSQPRSFHRRGPPTGEERIATILPRDYRSAPLVSVDPEIVGPAMERAILEVLPEVVEGVLRAALGGSAAFRALVSAAVEEAVREQLPDLASRVVRERLAEIEAKAARS